MVPPYQYRKLMYGFVSTLNTFSLLEISFPVTLD